MQSQSPLQIKSDEQLNRAGRRARDAQLRRTGQGDNAWGELKQLYSECLALLTGPAETVGLLRDQNALNSVKDKDALVKNYEILTKDLASFRDQLTGIRNEHSQREGAADGGQDLLECIQVGEKYQDWMARFQMVVLPTVNDITNQFYPDLHGGQAQDGEFIPAGYAPQH